MTQTLKTSDLTLETISKLSMYDVRITIGQLFDLLSIMPLPQFERLFDALQARQRELFINKYPTQIEEAETS